MNSNIYAIVQSAVQLATIFCLCILLVLASLYVLDQQQQRRRQAEYATKTTFIEVQLTGICNGYRTMVSRRDSIRNQTHWTIAPEQLLCTTQDVSQGLSIVLPRGSGPARDGSWFIAMRPTPLNTSVGWSASSSAFAIEWARGWTAPGMVIELLAPIEIMQ